jgi:hypothetical protein
LQAKLFDYYIQPVAASNDTDNAQLIFMTGTNITFHAHLGGAGLCSLKALRLQICS